MQTLPSVWTQPATTSDLEVLTLFSPVRSKKLKLHTGGRGLMKPEGQHHLWFKESDISGVFFLSSQHTAPQLQLPASLTYDRKPGKNARSLYSWSVLNILNIMAGITKQHSLWYTRTKRVILGVRCTKLFSLPVPNKPLINITGGGVTTRQLPVAFSQNTGTKCTAWLQAQVPSPA